MGVRVVVEGSTVLGESGEGTSGVVVEEGASVVVVEVVDSCVVEGAVVESCVVEGAVVVVGAAPPPPSSTTVLSFSR